MSSFSNVFFYSLFAGLSTLAGVYLVRHFGEEIKRNIFYLISFAVGVILANVFFYLLPQSANLTTSWIYAVLVGVIFLYLFEHFIIVHSCKEEICEVHTMGLTSTIGIGFHSLIDGIIIGIGFEVSFTLGFLTSLAVIFHELPEGVFTYSLLQHGNTPEKRSLLYSWIVALATPFGAILTFFLIRNISENLLGILLSLAAGSFIYIAASDLVPETHKRPNILNPLCVLGGIIFVFILGKFLK